jgi:hypothetical protein
VEAISAAEGAHLFASTKDRAVYHAEPRPPVISNGKIVVAGGSNGGAGHGSLGRHATALSAQPSPGPSSDGLAVLQWERLGGTSVATPAALATGTGALHVLALGSDGVARHRSRPALNHSLPWTRWAPLPAPKGVKLRPYPC